MGRKMLTDKYLGKTFESTSYGTFKIISYNGCDDVQVRFVDTGYTVSTTISNITRGNVRDRLKPTIFGVGILGESKTTSREKHCKEYILWVTMLGRCYDENKQIRQPTYIGCTVSDNLKYFPYFKEWCSKQVGFNNDGWDLDKDILIKGNKVYSESTCCFVPQEVNKLFTKVDKSRGSLLIGVHFYKKTKKYCASMGVDSKTKRLGYYSTEQEAFQAYKNGKETHVKRVANRWKDQIDVRVYEALMNYQVETTD